MRPPSASHQTVRLAAGRHSDPDDGMCVMELSSVLCGERFTDRPSQVCPFIAAFLRGYNDQLRDEERQVRLLPWAAGAVGTRSHHPDVLDRRMRLVERFSHDALPRWTRGRRRFASCRSLRCEYLGGRIGRWARGDTARMDEVDLLLTALSTLDDARPRRPDPRSLLPAPLSRLT